MSQTDELLKNNEAYAEKFDKGGLPLPPARKVAVVACMDARLNPPPARPRGGRRARDPQRGRRHHRRRDPLAGDLAAAAGDRGDHPIHHTDCGMLKFKDDDFKQQIQDDTGIKPQWAAESSGTLRRTSGSPRRASRRAPSSRTRARSAASSTTSTRAGCRKSPQRYQSTSASARARERPVLRRPRRARGEHADPRADAARPDPRGLLGDHAEADRPGGRHVSSPNAKNGPGPAVLAGSRKVPCRVRTRTGVVLVLLEREPPAPRREPQAEVGGRARRDREPRPARRGRAATPAPSRRRARGAGSPAARPGCRGLERPPGLGGHAAPTAHRARRHARGEVRGRLAVVVGARRDHVREAVERRGGDRVEVDGLARRGRLLRPQRDRERRSAADASG